MNERDKALQAWQAMSINASPDNIEGDDPSKWSAGADWAHSVYLGMREAWEEDPKDTDAIYTAASESLPVGTHRFWETFVDTCAYTEVDDQGGEMADTAVRTLEDMATRAGYSLFEQWNQEA